jgi:6-phosphogluconolactonase
MNGSVAVVPSVGEAFARRVTEILARPRVDRFSLFLSGGPTAAAAYARLAIMSYAIVDWSTVDVYWGDERCVPLDDPDSNHRLCHETLLDLIGPVGSDHPMYRSGPPEEAASSYQRELEHLTTFDLVHLGMGPDGHCASLFPDSPALAVSDPNLWVVAGHDPHALNPHDRITLTLPGIARGDLVIFTVSGAPKSEAFARVASGEALPAAQVTAAAVEWLVDPAAAGRPAETLR